MKTKSLFKSVAAAMLLATMSLTSCVQGDLYDDFIDDDMSSESMIARRKFKNDNGNTGGNQATIWWDHIKNSWQSTYSHSIVNSGGKEACSNYMWDFSLEQAYEMGGFEFEDGSCLLMWLTTPPSNSYSITLPNVQSGYHIKSVFHLHPGNNSTPSTADQNAARNRQNVKGCEGVQSYNYTRNDGFTNSLGN